MKGKGYQGIRETEVPGYENTRSNFKCFYLEKKEKLRQATGIPETQGAFSVSDKVTPDTTDGFTDEPVVQCGVQVDFK